MRHAILALFLIASGVAAISQTTAKPASTAATVHHAPVASSAARLPKGVPPVHGIVKTAFSLHYEDFKIGTGAEAEPNKMYTVLYTGWLGNNGRPDDGYEFDSSDKHRQPITDKDGKPVMGDDGKPKMGDPQPMPFPQGMGRLIPGFDQGFGGMRVGGKRRLFIPWQLAYGARGRPGPDAAHPGIPPKSDLIFDVELVDVKDFPAGMGRPGMSGVPGGRPMPPQGMPHPPTPSTPAKPSDSASPNPGAPASTNPSAAPSTTAPAAPAPESKPAPPATPPN